MRLIIRIALASLMIMAFVYLGNSQAKIGDNSNTINENSLPEGRNIKTDTSENLSTRSIQLLSFNAGLNDEAQVEISWTTVSEINNYCFAVEKTTDMKNFEAVAVLQGAGTSNEKHQYYIKDVNPYKGVSYYRLKQTDFDGNSTYSKFIPVEFVRPGLSLSVYPNPVVDVMSVTIEGEQNEAVLVYILDASGSKVYSDKVKIENGQCRICLLQKIRPGLYTFVVQGNNLVEQKKIVIR